MTFKINFFQLDEIFARDNYKFYQNGTYSNLTWNGSAWMDADKQYMQIRPGMHPGAAADVVLAWRVPSDVTSISISGTAADANAGGGDGLIATIKQGNTTLWGPTSIANGNITGVPHASGVCWPWLAHDLLLRLAQAASEGNQQQSKWIQGQAHFVSRARRKPVMTRPDRPSS